MEKLVCHFCNEELCPICTNIDDIPLICEDCSTSFHNCCITNYTINHNIGIPNILRCPNKECDVLLKIDEDEIIEVSGEVKVESVKEFMVKEVLEQIPKKLSKIKSLPKPISAPTQTEIEKIDSVPPSDNIKTGDETTKTIRVGGFFGKVYTVKKVNDKIVYERISTKATFKPNNSNTTNLEEKKTNISSSSKIPLKKTKSQASFMICQQCGKQINPNQAIKCPNCGFRIS
jgi:hypothetical protein